MISRPNKLFYQAFLPVGTECLSKVILQQVLWSLDTETVDSDPKNQTNEPNPKLLNWVTFHKKHF